jgi:hypothetical protein
MIDNPKQVADLLEKLQAALPLPAIIIPRLAATLREQKPGMSIPRECQVTWVTYAGDEGGIMCQLSFTAEAGEEDAFFVSITHLDFDPRLPLAREIAAYQQRRVKRIRRQNRRLG